MLPEAGQEIPDYLYNVPMEELGLSEGTVNLLKKTGMDSVGDCLLYFTWGNGAMIEFRLGVIETMETEVRQKLIEHGYLPPEDAES